MDFLNVIGYFFKKFLAQAVLMILGISILAVGMTKLGPNLQQNNLFSLGGVGMLLAGIISMLYVAEIIKKSIHTLLNFVLLPLGLIAYGYMDYRSIKDEIEYRNIVARNQKEVKQRLKDIRDAQLEYKAIKGKFTSDFDSLKLFIREGKAMVIKRQGVVPEKITPEMLEALGMKEDPGRLLTEQEAWMLSKQGLIPGFVRDTTYEDVMSKIFKSTKYMIARNSDYEFSVDSIDVVPYSGGNIKFNLKSGVIQRNGIDVPVFRAWEPNPLTKDTLVVGSLDEPTTNGNWGE